MSYRLTSTGDSKMIAVAKRSPGILRFRDPAVSVIVRGLESPYQKPSKAHARDLLIRPNVYRAPQAMRCRLGRSAISDVRPHVVISQIASFVERRGPARPSLSGSTEHKIMWPKWR